MQPESTGRSRPDPRSERGTILIFVGLAVVMLTAFTAFVLDYGVMWMSRRQAQNAADAGALAGIVSRAYDEKAAPGPLTTAAALQAVSMNPIMGLAGGAVVDVSDDACPAWATGSACVLVDVFRDGTNGSELLPAYLATLLGVTSQRVRATATAQVRVANASDCLRPFAIPDFFEPPATNYTYPGYTLDGFLGTELVLKAGPGSQLEPGWFRLLDMIDADEEAGGTNETQATITSCAADTFGAGALLTEQSGNEAAIFQGILDLYNLDDEAEWNGEEIINSCVEDQSCMRYDTDGNLVPDPSRTISPRVISLPVFDPLVYQTTGEVRLVNILGFFLTTQFATPPNFNIRGILVTAPGMVLGGAGSIDPSAAFLFVLQLIQ
jgi:Flp pilus assembly protein TadG